MQGSSRICTGETAALLQTDAQQMSFGDQGDLGQPKCQAKETGLSLASQAVKILPCSKQLPVCSIMALCLPPFHLLQLFTTTPPPKITTQITCSRVSRSSSVSAVQFVSCHVSSHPLPAGFAAHSQTASTPLLLPQKADLQQKAWADNRQR